MSNSLFQEDEANIQQLVELQQQAARIDLSEALSGDGEGEEEYTGSEEQTSDNENMPTGNVLDNIPYAQTEQLLTPSDILTDIKQDPVPVVLPEPQIAHQVPQETPNTEKFAEPAMKNGVEVPIKPKAALTGPPKAKIVVRPPPPNRGGVIRPPAPSKPVPQKQEPVTEPVGLLDDNLSEIKSTSSSPQQLPSHPIQSSSTELPQPQATAATSVSLGQSLPSASQGETRRGPSDPFMTQKELLHWQSSLSPRPGTAGMGQDSELLFNEGLFQFGAIRDDRDDRILEELGEDEAARDGDGLRDGLGKERIGGLGFEDEVRVGGALDGVGLGEKEVELGVEDRGVGDQRPGGISEFGSIGQDGFAVKFHSMTLGSEKFGEEGGLLPKISADKTFGETFKYPGGEQLMISRIATRVEADSPMYKFGSEAKVRTKGFEVDEGDRIGEVNEESTQNGGLLRNESIVERVEIPDYEPSPIMKPPQNNPHPFGLKPSNIIDTSVSPLLKQELSKMLNIQPGKAEGIPDLFKFVAGLVQENRVLKDKLFCLESDLNQAKSQLDFIPKLQSELESEKTKSYQLESELFRVKLEMDGLKEDFSRRNQLHADLGEKTSLFESQYAAKLEDALSGLDSVSQQYQRGISQIVTERNSKAKTKVDTAKPAKVDPKLEASKQELLSKLDQVSTELSKKNANQPANSDLAQILLNLQTTITAEHKKTSKLQTGTPASTPTPDPQVQELTQEVLKWRTASQQTKPIEISSILTHRPKNVTPDVSLIRNLSQLLKDSDLQRNRSLEAIGEVSCEDSHHRAPGESMGFDFPTLDELFPVFVIPEGEKKDVTSNRDVFQKPVLVTKKSDVTASKSSPDESSLSVSKVQVKERDSDQLTENPKSEKMVSPLLGRRNIILSGDKPTASRAIPFNLDPRTPVARPNLKQVSDPSVGSQTTPGGGHYNSQQAQAKRILNRPGAKGLFSKGGAASEKRLPEEGHEFVTTPTVSKTEEVLGQINSHGMITTTPNLLTTSDIQDQDFTPCSVMNNPTPGFQKQEAPAGLIEDQEDQEELDSNDNDSAAENPDLLGEYEGGKLMTIKDNLSIVSEMTPKGIGSITPSHIRRARINDARTIPFDNPFDNNYEKAKQLLINRYIAAPKDSTDSSPRSAINEGKESRTLSFDVQPIIDSKAVRKSSHDPLEAQNSPTRIMTAGNAAQRRKTGSQLYLIPEAAEVPQKATTSQHNVTRGHESDDEAEVEEPAESKSIGDKLSAEKRQNEANDELLQEEVSSTNELGERHNKITAFQQHKATSLMVDDEIHFSEPAEPKETTEAQIDHKVETVNKIDSGSLSQSNSMRLHEDTPIPVSVGDTPSSKHTSSSRPPGEEVSFQVLHDGANLQQDPKDDETDLLDSIAKIAPSRPPQVKNKTSEKPLNRLFGKPTLKRPAVVTQPPPPKQEDLDTLAQGIIDSGNQQLSEIDPTLVSDSPKTQKSTPEFEPQPLKSKPVSGLLKKPFSLAKSKQPAVPSQITAESEPTITGGDSQTGQTEPKQDKDNVIDPSKTSGLLGYNESPEDTEHAEHQPNLDNDDSDHQRASRTEGELPPGVSTGKRPVLLSHMSSDLWDLDKESPKFVNLEFALKELISTPVTKNLDPTSPIMGLVKKKRPISKGMSFGTAEVDELLGDSPNPHPDESAPKLSEINEVQSNGSPVNDNYGEDSPQKSYDSRFMAIGRAERQIFLPPQTKSHSAGSDTEALAPEMMRFASEGLKMAPEPKEIEDEIELDKLAFEPPKIIVSPPKHPGPPKGKILQIPRAPFRRPSPVPANQNFEQAKTILTSNDCDEDDMTRSKPRRKDSMDELFKNPQAKDVFGLDDDVVEDLDTLDLPQAKSPPKNSQSLQVDDEVSDLRHKQGPLKGTISMSTFHLSPSKLLTSGTDQPDPQAEPTQEDEAFNEFLLEVPKKLKPVSTGEDQDPTPLEPAQEQTEILPVAHKAAPVTSPPKPLAIKKAVFKQTKLPLVKK